MYVEKLPKIWSAVCIGVYLVAVVELGVDALPQDVGVWLIVSAAYLLVLLPCIAVPVSKAIYHRVRVDPGRGLLSVGRERIALTDVDPASVHEALRRATPGPVQRNAASAWSVDAPLRGLRAADRRAPRLVGGGWAVPMGMDSVVISTRRGEALQIATRDGRAFLTALAGALAPVS
ncbi:hypothetical protein [Streptomyces vilmorinianum]|uniref:hypothetical protein n=1 Tax=Streptomyces vilmorinianum TaxID=3051092 RepID=UPI0010FB0F7E|nr:hypothetical protein [Streptomyces vilmorinianum]